MWTCFHTWTALYIYWNKREYKHTFILTSIAYEQVHIFTHILTCTGMLTLSIGWHRHNDIAHSHLHTNMITHTHDQTLTYIHEYADTSLKYKHIKLCIHSHLHVANVTQTHNPSPKDILMHSVILMSIFPHSLTHSYTPYHRRIFSHMY